MDKVTKENIKFRLRTVNISLESLKQSSKSKKSRYQQREDHAKYNSLVKSQKQLNKQLLEFQEKA